MSAKNLKSENKTASSPASLFDLFKGMPSRRYPAKQIILFQGDTLTNVYYITSGYVRMHNITPKGNVRTMMILGPGETIPIIQATQAKYFYDALTDVECTFGTYEQISEHFLETKDYMQLARESGVKSMTRMMKQMEVIGCESAEEKIQKILIFLGEYYGKNHGKYMRISIKLTQQEIANLINLTRETVSSNMASLEKNKIIKTDGDGHLLVVKEENDNA